ncbi:glycosyltransferase [Nisaea denitrificans]|uniref:glycosyltransferase n=1 Tax=Nisaea denitrificans TaxID=390877 RepID=UPI0004051AEF|nr:nucleotide disphospho-sugar-binding domain-containing protein [Nisaea denitrificans]
MKKVLFAWELGDGLGHVSRLLPIANMLRDNGVECAFVVRNLIVTHSMIAREGYRVFQAPLVAPYAPPDVRDKVIASIGDVLATVGYVEPDKLTALTDGWAAIIDSFDPDLLISDYSPTAGLAVFGERPVVPIGDWFTLPPGNWSEFRTFKDAPNRVDPERLLETVREVQRRRGKALPDRVPALMHGERNFVVTIPELDPYHSFRENTESSPLRPLSAPATQEPVQDYFAYLSYGYAGTQKVLEALAGSSWTGDLYLRDANDEARTKWRERGLTIHDTPQPIEQAVANAKVVVHHGGIGTLEQVMAIGRPQCIVPRHFEQQKNGEYLGKLGSATVMKSGNKFQPEHIVQAVTATLTHERFAENARIAAVDLERRGPFNLLARITDYVLSTLNAR